MGRGCSNTSMLNVLSESQSHSPLHKSTPVSRDVPLSPMGRGRSNTSRLNVLLESQAHSPLHESTPETRASSLSPMGRGRSNTSRLNVLLESQAHSPLHESTPETRDSSLSPMGRGRSNTSRQSVSSDSHSNSSDHASASGVATASRKKVRVRQTTSKTRLERKLARNRGEEYTTSLGKLIPKKQAKPLDGCRMKCLEKINQDTAEELCDSIWKNLGDTNARRALIAGQISTVEKKTARVNPKSSRKRLYTFTYHAWANGKNIIVCKKCFMKIYQVSPKFIEIAVSSKLINPGGVQSKDQRGSGSGMGLAANSLEEIHHHINSFPRYKSHYGRSLTDKEFLPNTLSFKKMYDEYVKKVENPVSRWAYEREINKLGLKIKPLKVDTCHTCDSLGAAIRYAHDPAVKEAKIKEQADHHNKYQKAYSVKREDKAKAKAERSVEAVAFDMQQCLPTPNLSSSVVFYCRQLWVYNLTIHCMSSGTSIHNMWHEAEGGRGANQIGSALYNFILNLPDNIEHLILWSDCCAGQNKNGTINCALQAALSEKKTLKVIDQKFLVSGHTHLECDADHAIIEKKKASAPEIHIPRDWYNLVRSSSNRFTVQQLGQHQIDFKALHTGRGSPLVKRKATTSKEKFVWRNVVWIQHRRNIPKGVMAFKTSFEEEEFKYLDMRRKKGDQITLTLKPAYDGPYKISSKKKKDLLSLLHLIDPDCHSFYTSLITDDSLPEDCDPDILPISDLEDSEQE